MMDSIIHYMSVSHADSVMASVNKMRLDADLCDVVVVVGNIRIQAHEIILAASAPLFYQVSKTCSSPVAVPEYILEDVDEAAALKVIEFCYTSAISVDEESLWSIFVAATKLGCKEVIDLCCQLLTSSLDIDTCVRTHLMAAALDSDSLMKITGTFIAENIDMLCAAETCLCLTSQEILELVASLLCLQGKEETLLKLISAWLDHDFDGRIKLVMQLMEEFPSFAVNLQKYLESDIPSHKPQPEITNISGDVPDLDKMLPGRIINNGEKNLNKMCDTKYRNYYRGQHRHMFREVPLYICVSCGEAFDGQSQLSQHLQECIESVNSRNGFTGKQVVQPVDKGINVSDNRTHTSDDVFTYDQLSKNVSKFRPSLGCSQIFDQTSVDHEKISTNPSVGTCNQGPDLHCCVSEVVSLVNGQYPSLQENVEHAPMVKESVTGDQLQRARVSSLHDLSTNKFSSSKKCQRKDESHISLSESIENLMSSSTGFNMKQISAKCLSKSIQFCSTSGNIDDNTMNALNNNNDIKEPSSDDSKININGNSSENCHNLVEEMQFVDDGSDHKFQQASRGKRKPSAGNSPADNMTGDRHVGNHGFSNGKLQSIQTSKKRLFRFKCHICNQAFNERKALVNHQKHMHDFVEDISSEHSNILSKSHGSRNENKNKKGQSKSETISKNTGYKKIISDLNGYAAEKSSHYFGSQYNLSRFGEGTAEQNLDILKQNYLRQYSDYTQHYIKQGSYFCQMCGAHHPKYIACQKTNIVCRPGQNCQLNEADQDEMKKKTDCDMMDVDNSSDSTLSLERSSAAANSNVSNSCHSPLDLSKYCSQSVAGESSQSYNHSSISSNTEHVSHNIPLNLTNSFPYSHYPRHTAPLTVSVASPHKQNSDLVSYNEVLGKGESSGRCIYPLDSGNDITVSSPTNDAFSLSTKRKVLSRQGFPCAACSRVFTYQAALLTHMRTHSLPAHTHQCQFCQQSFAHASDLKVHICPNGIEKPYTCPSCDQTFAKNIHLKRHLATHSGLKPYPCWICGKRFSRSDHLKRHTQSLHAGSRPHACKTCGKEFVRKYELNKHMIVHSVDVSGSS